MSISKWDPFRDLLSLQERMNRLFEESFSKVKYPPDESVFSGTWIPPVDIYETEEEMVMKAEIPGMKKEDISIEVKDNILTLKGERKIPKECERGKLPSARTQLRQISEVFHIAVRGRH